MWAVPFCGWWQTINQQDLYDATNPGPRPRAAPPGATTQATAATATNAAPRRIIELMDKITLLNEARYAERLCQRTARLYRHLQASTVFLSVLGGSGVMSALAQGVPAWVPVAGAVVLATFGAVNLAVRPADKAAANEADCKRYAQLRTAGQSMTEAELSVALNKARESDTAEVEALREVAFNDLVREMGRSDAQVPLKPHQRVLGALA